MIVILGNRQELVQRYEEKSPTLVQKEMNMIEEIVQIARKRKDSEDLPTEENKFEGTVTPKEQ